jgi:hypothetical protein
MADIRPDDAPWLRHGWVEHTQLLLDSFRRWLGRDLIPHHGSAVDRARELFQAPFVVVSHGVETDPILSYGNRAALELWEFDIATLLATPSRLTAEPGEREDRARLLERTARQGYADDYEGIRISRTGRRFRIRRAVVWNLVDAREERVGQAATFEEWEFVGIRDQGASLRGAKGATD